MGEYREAMKSAAQEDAIRAKVTKRGVLIPSTMLEGVDEVDIQRSQDLIVVKPVRSGDPILSLGGAPGNLDISDASVDHDRYLYDR